MNLRDEKRIADLERRIGNLERLLGSGEVNTANVVGQQDVAMHNESLSSSRATAEGLDEQTETDRLCKDQAGTPQAHRVSETGKRIDWELQFGKVWMPRIFIIVLLIGVMWGFTAAVQAGWINQPVRIVTGYIVVAGLGTYGQWQMMQQRRALGQVLLGGSNAVAVLTTFAASTLYQLIPPTPAFILAVVFALAGVLLSLRHASQTLALISLVAAVLVPFLIKSQHPNLNLFIVYESLVSFGFLFYGLKKRYLYLAVCSLASLHLSFITLTVLKNLHANAMTIPVIVQMLALLVVTLLYSHRIIRKHRVMLGTMTWFSMTLATLWVYGELHVNLVHIYLWLVAGVLALAAVLNLIYKWEALVVCAFPFWIFLASASFSVVSHKQFYFLAVAIATAATVISTLLKNHVLKLQGYVLMVLSGVLLCTVYAPFGGHSATVSEHLTWLFYTLCSLSLVFVFMRKEAKDIAQLGTWFGIVVLGLFLSHEAQVFTVATSVNVQHMVLSFVWILYAIAAIVFGVIGKHTTYRRFGIIFLFVTLSKLVLIDIPAVTLFVRAVLFMAIGTVGVLISRVFYKNKPSSN